MIELSGKKVEVWGKDASQQRQVIDELKRLGAVDYVVVVEAFLVEGVLMPYINVFDPGDEPMNGEKFFGMSVVKKLVDAELATRAGG